MFTKVLQFLLVAAALAGCQTHQKDVVSENWPTTASQPNVLIVYMDDLGIGDLGTYNPATKIPTPNLDNFAARSMVFTDAHSVSSVCTPSRYGLLTGRYAWRTWLKAGVTGGYSPSVIREGEQTVAAFLKDAGYRTAMVGKWHLGFGSDEPDMSKFANGFTDKPVDFSTPPDIRPTTLGFDYFYGLSASLDFPPYAYIENGTYEVPPSTQIPERREGEYLDGGFFWREGAKAENFEFEDVEPHLVGKVIAFIDDHARDHRSEPFFLYYASPAPHTPIMPTEEHRGRSQAGRYGDFVAQTDASFGKIQAKLEETGLAENTIIIFTSDNGAVHYADLHQFHHRPNAPYRGMKSELFEGGHRVPFIVSWPARIAPGRSDRLVMQTDIFRTLADITDSTVAFGEAVDSFSFADSLASDLRRSTAIRSTGIMHSLFGTFSVRKRNWKLVMDDQSGGYGASYPSLREGKLPDPEFSRYRLYNLSQDLAEANDVAMQHPQLVDDLARILARARADGRTVITAQH